MPYIFSIINGLYAFQYLKSPDQKKKKKKKKTNLKSQSFENNQILVEKKEQPWKMIVKATKKVKNNANS